MNEVTRLPTSHEEMPRGDCTGLDAPRVLDRVRGLSYRQLDYWTRTGRITAHTHPFNVVSGSGVPHCWPRDEVEVAARMFRLIRLGFNLAAATDLARDHSQMVAGSALLLRLAEEMRPPAPGPLPGRVTPPPARAVDLPGIHTEA